MADLLKNTYFLFDSLEIVKGSKINTVDVDIPVRSSEDYTTNTQATVYGDDTMSPTIPTTSGEMAAKTKTTATNNFSYAVEKYEYQILYTGYTDESETFFKYGKSNPFGIPVGNTYVGGGLGGVWPENIRNYYFVHIDNIELDSTDIIHSATLKLGNYWADANIHSCAIYGNDVDDATPPQTANALLNLTKTTATVGFLTQPTDFLVETDDLSDIINEIIQRPGWSRGNAITFIFWPVADTGVVQIDVQSGNNFLCKEKIQTTGYEDVIQEIVDRSDWESGSELGLMFFGINNESDLSIPQSDYTTELSVNATGYATYIKFDSIGIEKGMQIQNAYVDFAEISDFFQAAATCRIYAEKTATASEFADGDALWAATKTATYVDYTESATSGAATTPDIKTVIQEIINQANWSYGNNINLIFWGINNNAYKADISGVSASLRLTI